jgi:hypothetical protein
VTLRALTLRGLPARAIDVLKLSGVQTPARGEAGVREPALSATFETPRGEVTLDSWT